MASAWLESPMAACQSVTGNWLAMRVDARSARSSMTSVRSRRSASRSGATWPDSPPPPAAARPRAWWRGRRPGPAAPHAARCRVGSRGGTPGYPVAAAATLAGRAALPARQGAVDEHSRTWAARRPRGPWAPAEGAEQGLPRLARRLGGSHAVVGDRLVVNRVA